jgi:3-dehydroquinate dehydratase
MLIYDNGYVFHIKRASKMAVILSMHRFRRAPESDGNMHVLLTAVSQDA